MRVPPFAPRSAVIAVLLLLVIIAAATVGYVAIEGWSWFDAFYMTILTVSTTGGGEPHPLSAPGRVLTITVIVLGFGVLSYTLLLLFAYIIEGRFHDAVLARRMRRIVSRMHDHFVLCGYGRVGREIARAFARERIAFVIVDINQSSLERATADGYAVVEGNAADIPVLREAGIDRARGLVTAVDNDADNLYVTLSARTLKPELFIVARANMPDAEPKLRLAGANRTISPYTIGGRRMASLAMRPTAVEFVDTVLSAGNSELLLEDMTIPHGSPWVGRSVADLAADTDVVVLAIKRANAMQFRPPTDTVLSAADELVAAGPRDGIRVLEQRL